MRLIGYSLSNHFVIDVIDEEQRFREGKWLAQDHMAELELEPHTLFGG